MNALILRAVLLTMFCCAVAGFIVVRRQERRHEAEQLHRDEQWREYLWQQATGVPPPALTGAERAEFAAIASRLKRQDSGLDIIITKEQR